ncbi:MAG: hypothetical protein HY705_09710 [Gemmatimonadetes bacterium]|nr:hypothetical protein [Gemmatimonadota bacterium]
MKPLLEFEPFWSTGRRKWILSLSQEERHRWVRLRLFVRSSRLQGVSFNCKPGGEVATLEEMTKRFEERIVTDDPSYELLPNTLLADVMTAVKQAAGNPAALSLPRVLQLLERVTVDLGGATVNRAAYRRATNASPLRLGAEVMDLGSDWAAREVPKWIEWCASTSKRDVGLLTQYEYVREQLARLDTKGAYLSAVLQERLGVRGGHLRFGHWSVEVRDRWKVRSEFDWAPSEWAIFLLAEKERTHTRAIKQRLAAQNLERQIGGAWAQYGGWLSERPDELRELEILLGGIAITPAVGTEDAGKVGTNSDSIA